jgi:endonuclease YncB( thermonuclease family)
VPTETTVGAFVAENAVEGVTEPATFKVIKIVDGDTIDVLTDDKETIRLRFNGIGSSR